MPKDQWITKGEGSRLDALEAAVERLGPLVLKYVEMLEARKDNHDPSPSDVPAPPEMAAAVAEEARRLRARYTGTTKAMMDQARKNATARGARLDGEALVSREEEAGPRTGGTLDGRPLHARKRRGGRAPL